MPTRKQRIAAALTAKYAKEAERYPVTRRHVSLAQYLAANVPHYLRSRRLDARLARVWASVNGTLREYKRGFEW